MDRTTLETTLRKIHAIAIPTALLPIHYIYKKTVQNNLKIKQWTCDVNIIYGEKICTVQKFEKVGLITHRENMTQLRSLHCHVQITDSSWSI